MRAGLAGVVVLVAACRSTPPAKPAIDNHDGPATGPAAERPPDPRVTAIISEARGERDAGEREGCIDTLSGIDEAWLGSPTQGAEALALMKDCTGREDDYCDYYIDVFNEGDDASAYCVLSLAVALGPRVAYADALPTACGFGTVEGAVAIPGDGARCLAIEGGDGIALEDLPEDGKLPPGVCPSVSLIERRGDGVVTHAVAHDGGSFMDDASTCCNATGLRVRRRGDVVEVVIESGGPSRDCFGGTASVDHLEVYRLDGERLVPIDDLDVGMH